MAFDFFINNSERVTAMHFNRSFNRLMVKDMEDNSRTIPMDKEHFNNVTLWEGTRMHFETFLEFVKSEL